MRNAHYKHIAPLMRGVMWHTKMHVYDRVENILLTRLMGMGVDLRIADDGFDIRIWKNRIGCERKFSKT